MMLVSDMVLLWDAGFKKQLEVYAADEGALKADFGRAFKRLTENGFQGCPFAPRASVA
jgi:catalase (peroxidase I)